MPETTVAPSAPAAPAPAAAPAAGGSSATPAWGGDDVGSFMAGITSNSPATTAPVPAATPAPAAAAAIAEPTPTPATATTVAAPETSVEPPAPVQPPAENQPQPAPATEPAKPTEILLAGRFKTANPEVASDPGVQALVKAYDSSSIDGRRNFAIVEQNKATIQKLQADLEARQAEIEMTKLEQAIGPELKEPSAEEMAAWTPAQVAKFYADKTERNSIKRDIERQKKDLDTRKKAESAQAEQEIRQRQDHIKSVVNQMGQDPVRFPRYNELVDTMGGILNMEPALIGRPNTPLIAYLAAYGHEALQRDMASREATNKAAQAARVKAEASAAAAGGSGGAGGPAPEPPKPAGTTPPTGSDAEHNARLIEAHTGSRPMLPVD